MSFEAQLSDVFGRYADLAPTAAHASIAERAIASGRPRRLGLWGWAPSRRAVASLAVALLLLAALATAILVGALITRHGRLLGSFSETGASRIPFITAAVALGDGRAVVFGEGRPSDDGSAGVTQIELFDPDTKTYAPLAKMPEARNGFTATVLRDGNVLIAGGDTASQVGPTSMAAAELFDPRTGAFTATGSMRVARTQHSATLLADGRVLVIAGQAIVNGNGNFDFTAEIYDPASGSWSDAGTMTARRSAYATLLLGDGRVLVAGGWDQEGDGVDFASVEAFDPATRSFAALGEMLTPRRSPTAARLADGRLLVVGGYLGNTVLATAEVFEPTTGRSTATGSLTTSRHDAATLTLTDGRVVVVGGSNLIGSPLSSEFYDPATGTFTRGAFATHEHGPGVQLKDGRLLLTGSASEIFDPNATTAIATDAPRTYGPFRLAGAPVVDRTAHTATKLADGRVLFTGGLASQGAHAQGYAALGTAELYDPRSDTFTATGSLLVPPDTTDVTGKLGNDALLLDDGRVLMLVQQRRFRQGPALDLQSYDPVTGQFTLEGTIESSNDAMAPARFLQLPDGHLILVGAPLKPAATPTQDMSVYRIDRPTIQATEIGTLSGCGTVVAAQLTSADRVAVLCRSSASHASVVLFDPETGTSTASAVAMSPGAAAMVLLKDGRLLVAGGSGSTALTLVNPTNLAATPAGIVQTAPQAVSSWPETAGISMTVLADGRVLILGGREASVWDPTTGTATSIVGPTVSRDGHTATLLDDGHVLVVGGTVWSADNGVPPPAGAELFDPAAFP